MLTEFWSHHADRGFHPDDDPHIPRSEIINWTPEQARACFHLLKSDKWRGKVHQNLFAIPYLGNLEQAKVFVLFGNPSLGKKTYKHEHFSQFHVSRLTQNLLGKNKLFMYLEPLLQGKRGSKYWSTVFRHLAEDIAQKSQVSEEEAWLLIAQRLAVLEACAYRSKNNPGDWTEDLPSSKLAREFVHKTLVPKAEAGEILLFVWRCAEFWRVPSDSDHVLVRDTDKAQLRYLFREERKAIRKTLLA